TQHASPPRRPPSCVSSRRRRRRRWLPGVFALFLKLQNRRNQGVFHLTNPLQTPCRGRKPDPDTAPCKPHARVGIGRCHPAVMEPPDGGSQAFREASMLGIHELWLFVLSGL